MGNNGGIDGDFSFYVKDEMLHWAHNYVSSAFYHVGSSEIIPEGRHQLGFEFEITDKPDIASGKDSP